MSDAQDELAWREAERNDRELLKTFTCTTPAPRYSQRRQGMFVHRSSWELTTQSYIRGLKGIDSRYYLNILGFTDAQLVSVVSAEYKPADQIIVIHAIGRCLHHRGLGIASKTLDELIRRIEVWRVELNFPADEVYAYIHPDNDASQVLFSSRGFVLEDVEDGFQVWILDLTSLEIEAGAN